jgi:hypothetical protein
MEPSGKAMGKGEQAREVRARASWTDSGLGLPRVGSACSAKDAGLRGWFGFAQLAERCGCLRGTAASCGEEIRFALFDGRAGPGIPSRRNGTYVCKGNDVSAVCK